MMTINAQPTEKLVMALYSLSYDCTNQNVGTLLFTGKFRDLTHLPISAAYLQFTLIVGKLTTPTGWGPSLIAKLVNITIITNRCMILLLNKQTDGVYNTKYYNYIINPIVIFPWVYKPLNQRSHFTGGHHPAG